MSRTTRKLIALGLNALLFGLAIVYLVPLAWEFANAPQKLETASGQAVATTNLLMNAGRGLAIVGFCLAYFNWMSWFITGGDGKDQR